MSKKRTPKQWALFAARYGLLAAAIAYLVYAVNWNDRVKLADDQTVRLIEYDREAERFTVERDGERETLPKSAVKYTKQNVPAIQPGLVTAVRQIDVNWALLALLVFAPVPFLQSLRLVWMLGIQNVHISYWKSVKFSFAGNFFNFALPGTTGGDLVKAYYLTKHTPHKTEAFTTVFLDRVVGLLGIFTFATVMIVLKWQQSDVNLGAYLLIPAGAFAGLLGLGAIILSRRLRTKLRLRALAERLPLGHHVVRVGQATLRMRAAKLRLGSSFALTVVLQVFVFVSAFVMSRALAMDGGFLHFMIFVPIGFMIAAIPISPPQAFGVMEAAFIEFFTGPSFANSASQAVTFALALRVTQLCWALPGGLVPALGAHVPRRDELEALEAEAEQELEATPAVETVEGSTATPTP